MTDYLIKGGIIINEGKRFTGDLLIRNGCIEKIGTDITVAHSVVEINAIGKYVLPGCIDDQVHFREPGLTHKGTIYSESRAAVAGGTTSFMEMPNTIPNALTQDLLQQKYDVASKTSLANYSFFMGASNENIEEVLKTDGKNICGIKVFMGSSTGNMLVDNEKTLIDLFSRVPLLIATHCEDEGTIKANLAYFNSRFGDEIPIEAHPQIRSVDACYLSSSLAVSLAKKYQARLHVLHISTAKETTLFDNSIALEKKLITAEACIHHLWFSDEDYSTKGNWIKWNPAIKSKEDREEIWKALLDNRIDVIASDHAPHTISEKQNNYSSAPSGGPLVEHTLLAMLEKSIEGKISIERIVEKMAHAPAILFRINNRGFLREGYAADIVIVDPDSKSMVSNETVHYHCAWSPFDGQVFSHSVSYTFINGCLVFKHGKIIDEMVGQRLSFKI
ncbi:MAG: dihydroorotase [Flavobacteriia bacterium]|nr:dihydroorotase [Flavobacteriia bacterium]